MMPVYILCGGEGSRLGDITKGTPKSMVRIYGKPFISYQLEWLRDEGIKEVTLCVRKFADQIFNFVGDGSKWGMRVRYSYDGNESLGTAGAFKKATNGTSGAVFILYGDSYLPKCGLKGMEETYCIINQDVLMLLYEDTERHSENNVYYDRLYLPKYYAQKDGHTCNYTDAGISIVNIDYLNQLIPDGFSNLSEIFELASKEKMIYPYITKDPYMEIGSLQGINRLETHVKCTFADVYFQNASRIAQKIDQYKIYQMANIIQFTKRSGGRLFILGVGGSAATASHAVNDFEKLCGVKTYTPTDNVSELTARTNDQGWENSFVDWLKVQEPTDKDVILVLSVGGGDINRKISMNIVKALEYAQNECDTSILGIVGKEGGYTQRVADVCIVIPTVDEYNITPFAESFQSLILHCLVSHPILKKNETTY